jgi:hypothetical protein
MINASRERARRERTGGKEKKNETNAPTLTHHIIFHFHSFSLPVAIFDAVRLSTVVLARRI